MKLGLLIDFDLLKAATSTNTKPKVVLSDHLEKLTLRHISAVGGSIQTKFGSLMQNNTLTIMVKGSEKKRCGHGHMTDFLNLGIPHISVMYKDRHLKFGKQVANSSKRKINCP